jgi:hypothetical protein
MFPASLQLYQIAVVLVSLTMMVLGFQRFFQRRLQQSFLKLSVRILVWGGLAVLALYPNLADRMAEFIGIGDNISALVVIGFLLTFLMIFKILSIIERVEQDISTLTRRKALDEFEKRKRK